MQTSLTYRTNRDLFSNHYLDDHLRKTDPWNEVSDADVVAAYEEIIELWTAKRGRVDDYNEAQLEKNFIWPLFEILGLPFEIEETVKRNARRPDYGFFPSEDVADAAFDCEDFYEEATAVADAKRWGRKLDTRGKEKHDFENPSYQIHRYLQETPTQWAVLTNGAKWRLYYGPTSHRLDSYYEIDLPELLDVVERQDDFEAFKEFYLFFRQEAFLPDQTGGCFLDDIYDESSVFAEELSEDLQENIYEAIRVLAAGFLDTNDNLGEEDLALIHDSSLIYLYRLIFVLYAESEGRKLLPTDNGIYSESYSINKLKQEVIEKRDATQQSYQTWQTDLWDQLDELFVLIDQGSRGKGIPEDDLSIPAYNGGLFRTNPDEDGSVESQFLANYEAGDAYLAEVIELLTRHKADDGNGKEFVDYSSLDERYLGSIYEGLLEYKLDVADEPLTVDDGAYTPAGETDDITIEAGDVYLQTDDGERKATGSYYTPEYIVEYIVDETLGPLVEEIRTDLMSQSADTDHSREGGFADDFANRIFDLTVLDPAMGSGHFPVNAVDYLARKIIDAQEKQDRQAMDADNAEVRAPTTEEGELRDINWARRKVAQRCIYGVDVNPLATELAKVSLWLRTLAAEQPLAFLDHHLKTGNSLVGSDIEEVLADDDGDVATGDGQLTLQQSFDHTRWRAMEHVTDRFQDLLNIDNETLEDAKEMEAVYDDVRDDPLYRKLLAMANVHTADAFGLDVPADADERMARALHSNAWETIEDQDWFNSAQAIADDERFFHWELEFPTAFYDQDGERMADAGFDAVIGNPPYVLINKSTAVGSYYESIFATASGYKPDLYMPFVELSTQLGQQSGEVGLIVPNRFFLTKAGSNLRQCISERNVRRIVNFDQSKVFGDALNYVCILLFSPDTADDDTFGYTVSDADMEEMHSYELPRNLIQGETWSVPNEEIVKVSREIEPICTPIETVIEDMFTGVQTGADEILIRDEPIEGEQDLFVPFLRSKDIRRYRTNQDAEYVIFPYDSSGDILPEKELSEQYPQTYDYLNTHQSDLEDRIWHNQGPVERSGEWYGLMYLPSPDKFVADKIVCPYLASKSVFTYDTQESIFGTGAGYGIKTSGSDSRQKAFVCLLNSTMVNTLFTQISPEFQSGFKFNKTYVEQIPIPQSLQSDSEILVEEIVTSESQLHERDEKTVTAMLAVLYDTIRDAFIAREGLNLDLQDYLGNYKEGPNLPDIGLFQPTGSNILDTTTEEYEKLQIERVRTKRDGSTVTIEATARYKPEDEDEFETDTYGYTETAFFEAFTLMNLTDEEVALVEVFIPVAVDDEISGFRDNATQTYSLVDRLKGMALPDLDDVADDLRRFIETKERADELDEQIDKTEQLIDEIVYDLYNLTDEQIEIVEQAVAND